MKRIYLRLFLLLVILQAISGMPIPWLCAGETGRIEKLVVGTTMDIKSIGMDDYYFGTLQAIMTHLALVKLDEHGNITGDMAGTWQTRDAKTWTFYLKTGLIWHDGMPVTADDVAFSLTYLPEKIPVYRSHFSLIESVEARDSRTVVIRLHEPNPRFLVNMLVLRTIPRHIYQGVSDPKRYTDLKAAIGCGPYVFDYFDPSSGTIGFRLFEKYYRGKPIVNHVVFRMFRNPDTLYLALRKGEIDLPYFYAAGTAPSHASPLLKDPTIRIHTQENTGVPNALFINTHKPLVDQADFRRALALSIKYEEIVRLIAGGYGSIPNAGFVPRGSADFVETQALAYRPDQARQILDRMGYIDGNGDGIREKDGKPAELELVFRMDLAGNSRLAELLREYFQAVGIRLILRPVDMTLFRTISDQERSHTLMLSRATPWGMMMWAGCGTGYLDRRNIGWTLSDDPRFVSIVDRMNQTLDPGDYKTAAGDLQRYLAEDLPAIPLYWDRLIQPSRARFEGWKTSPMYGVLWEETWFHLREVSK